MKYIVFLIATGFAAITHAYEQSFTVEFVGASRSTGSVFVNVIETAQNSNCVNTNILRVPFDDVLEDKFYATALAAHAQNKPLIVSYEPDDCVSNGVAPQYFKIGH